MFNKISKAQSKYKRKPYAREFRMRRHVYNSMREAGLDDYEILEATSKIPLSEQYRMVTDKNRPTSAVSPTFFSSLEKKGMTMNVVSSIFSNFYVYIEDTAVHI